MPDQFLHGIEVVQIDDGLRPIQTVKSSIIGLIGYAPDADEDRFPLDTPVLVTGPRQAGGLGAGGTLKAAYTAMVSQGVNVAVVIRVEADTAASVLGDPTAGTGVWGFLVAGSVTGQVPRILAAPGYTSTPAADGVNPVTSALITVAERLRAVVVADGPNTTEADAITDAGKYGSDRLFIVDPAVRVAEGPTGAIVTRPASPFVAGLIAKRDAEKGFWWSPSNQVIEGVRASARPISFQINSPETEANRLNEAKAATIVHQNGYRLWGDRTTATDPLWTFLNVRRTADMIYESIEAAHLWAMDRPFSAQLVLDIRDSVQAYINTLVVRGALLGGRVWLDPELNTETELKAGKLYLDFDIEPPAPLEHLTFRAHRNGSYYDELVGAVANAA